MATLEEILNPKGWKIMHSDNEKCWPKGHTVLFFRNAENKLDLRWTDSDNHPLELRGVSFVDDQVQGLQVQGLAESDNHGTYSVRLDEPDRGTLRGTVKKPLTSAQSRNRMYDHLSGVWGAEAGG